MINLPGHIAGIRIIESLHAYKHTDVPNRPHTKTRSMSERYHTRIQKKWIKRWGYEIEYVCYKTPQAFIMHPVMRRQLEAQLNNS